MTDLETVVAVIIILALVIGIALSLLISAPLDGTLVRFRANYTPKGLALDGDNPGKPHVGPVVTNYFQMFSRVKRIEGYSGLFKGIMPTAILLLLIGIFSGLWIGTASATNPGSGKSAVLSLNLFELLVFALFVSIVSIPATIIVNRTIVTPHKLPTWRPLFALRILLTQHERSQPWILFLTPGLALAQSLRVLWIVLVQHTARRWLLPSSFIVNDLIGQNRRFRRPADFTTGRFTAYFLVLALSTPILTALQVMITRLSLQRNHVSDNGFTVVPQDENARSSVRGHGAAGEDIEFAGLDEDVVGLRPEDDPYTGIVDCAKRILDEEGAEVLLRGWWITLLVGCLGVFNRSLM
ncbi:mitochondrial carrier [Auriculariales sp. MPI-PUGE-AT-0066]|nr:mitochondrial carrier [Auriculariales sp. MPI-PUGE-AT-0066]